MADDLMIYGCRDESLSPHLKCFVTQGKVTVIGQLPEGYSRSLQHNWESPFQSGGGGSVLEKFSALAQHASGRTVQGYLNFLQIWAGTEPQTFSIPLLFEGIQNPRKEVEQAVNFLEAMSSPLFSREIKGLMANFSTQTLKDFALEKIKLADGVGNRVPQSVSISLGRKFILPDVKIVSVEVEDPMEKTKDGFSLRQNVTLNVSTDTVSDAVDILARGV